MTEASEAFGRLVALMARLRAGDGCPWDLAQTHDSIKGHLVEEAYETVDAIGSKDDDLIAEELGDLLLQIVFHARIAQERSAFDMADVCDRIVAKIERRHPHIFGDAEASTPEEVLISWEAIKREEKAGTSALAGVPVELPALMYSQRLQHKAAHVGFDWESDAPVYEKLAEEIAELKEVQEQAGVRSRDLTKGAMDGVDSATRARLEEELGDVLFTAVNLGRKLGLDSETALRSVAAKFRHRFELMEDMARAEGRSFATMSLVDQDALWERAKAEEGGT